MSGKGSQGRIIVYPPKESTFSPESIIVGNVVLYGPPAARRFNGMAGEIRSPEFRSNSHCRRCRRSRLRIHDAWNRRRSGGNRKKFRRRNDRRMRMFSMRRANSARGAVTAPVSIWNSWEDDIALLRN